MHPQPQAPRHEDVVRDIAARSVTAVGLAGIALIHLLDAIGKYSETRYLFWMYVALITGSLAVAGAVLSHGRGWRSSLPPASR
jgi:peptidoglycan/LPS O-acetylase OafA/YrhL